MIVCLCNAVSENDIYRAAMDGVNTMQQLSDRLYAGTCCGICNESANQCLEEAKYRKNSIPFPE